MLPDAQDGHVARRFPSRDGVLRLHPDRFFDPDPTVRRIARALHEQTRTLPLVCPHGHVDPRLLATDEPFPEPTALIVTPDHYVLRMLYSRGVPLEALGIPTRDGTSVERDPRRVWQRFGEHYHLFRGTPSGVWLDHELGEVFGVRQRLSGDTAQRIYDEIAEKLASPEFRPRALYERFNIEVLATTDRATDALEWHRAIRDSGWHGVVLPTFRPDALFQVAAPLWRDEVAALERASGIAVRDYDDFLRALVDRRLHFRAMGATATDHGVEEPYTTRLDRIELDAIFRRALAGEATAADQRRFEAHLLVEMARLSCEDGLVMQLHAGALRNHNAPLFARFGPDRGADIPLATEYTRNLHALLNAHGNDPRLTLVLFTLDESTYARELAPLAGHYPAVRLGPPWWFHDSLEGMRRFRERTTETAGFYNTAGFNDDTRAFCSIPARHDVARRMDANYLAGLVARHVIGEAEARELARALAYDLARETYRLDRLPAPAASARSAPRSTDTAR
ncbi:MAG TPA: glucuronate isomerase [Gemmatimonadaceae bacterium]|nr:glucuronate isomerase [Gemmatimonadaceae bacterium]